MNMFGAPAAADKFCCQPIKQFGMRRLRALRPKIAGGGDEASSKMLLPDEVHPNARSQWIVPARQPID